MLGTYSVIISHGCPECSAVQHDTLNGPTVADADADVDVSESACISQEAWGDGMDARACMATWHIVCMYTSMYAGSRRSSSVNIL